MRKLFIARVEIEIPIEAEDEKEAEEYLKNDGHRIIHDFYDCIEEAHVEELAYGDGCNDPETGGTERKANCARCAQAVPRTQNRGTRDVKN